MENLLRRQCLVRRTSEHQAQCKQNINLVPQRSMKPFFLFFKNAEDRKLIAFITQLCRLYNSELNYIKRPNISHVMKTMKKKNFGLKYWNYNFLVHENELISHLQKNLCTIGDSNTWPLAYNTYISAKSADLKRRFLKRKG